MPVQVNRFRGLFIGLGLLVVGLVAALGIVGGVSASRPSGGTSTIVAGLLAAAPLAPEANMVVNGDFETGSLSPNWPGTVGSPVTASITSTVGFVRGTYSAKIVTTSNSNAGIAGGGACSGGARI